MLRPVIALAATVACACSAGCRQPGSAPTPPNVLLVSIDTLRPDHLSCYGHSLPTSPIIDTLAAEGVLFTDHVSSSSWTLPAHAALFTSLPDSVHGCTDTDRRLAEPLITLAERFATAGYATAGFFSGPYLHPVFGLAQGFEHYQNCTSYGQHLDQQPVARWAMDPAVMRRSHRDVTSPYLTSEVLTWLAEDGRQDPFFLFVHMWDPHFDFIPPAPYDTIFDPEYEGWVTGEDFFFDPRIGPAMDDADLAHLVALYDGEIRWTDAHLGRILGALIATDRLERTVVAVTSDHGTEFFEHGDKGHRKTLYDEVIRVPLILRYPSRLNAGVRVQGQTRTIDVGPTLLDLAGLAPTGQEAGRTLLPMVRDQAELPRVAISELFSVGRSLRTVRTADWKLFADLAAGRRFYIDRHTDPAERQPLTDWSSRRGASVQAACRQAEDELAALAATHAHELDEPDLPAEIREQLESLGYVDPDG